MVFKGNNWTIYYCPIFKRNYKKRFFIKSIFIIIFLLNFIFPIFRVFLSLYSKKYYDLFKATENSLNLNFIKGNIFYFIYGFYINRILIIKNYTKIFIYVLGIIGLIFTTKIIYIISIKKKEKIFHYFGPINLNIFLYAQCIFFLNILLNLTSKKYL